MKKIVKIKLKNLWIFISKVMDYGEREVDIDIDIDTVLYCIQIHHTRPGPQVTVVRRDYSTVGERAEIIFSLAI